TGVEEWGMIELQGDIIDKTDGSLHGKVIGDLHFTRQNVPVLIIGHNILHGEIINLSKPFAVLRRVKKDDGADLLVTAVIKRKLIFRVRIGKTLVI
ncbi:hypothetical protein ACTXT7_011969, partial [Hymenolepis weldensis]